MMKLDTKAAFEIDEAGFISGTAWPFASPDRVGDIITKGAFAGSLSKPLPMLFGHDPNDPVGVWTRLEETDTALIIEGQLLTKEVARAREVHALVKAGALSGLSVGFITRKSAPRSTRGRTITALDLFEVSLVTIPSHPGARITTAKNGGRALALAEALNRAAARLAI